ncbi:uracil-DNA glycosylase [Chlorobium sp. N1]|uniref:uracil-DNA glycosylase n=1 Tax=Chlorobium sp. N1 TaxID=2491138 RepID=UPI001F6081AB|nr:uracil-DNA glycosylase [Chlorobium sp. N1]
MSPAHPNEALEQLRRECLECRRCGLAETRNSVVFGEGDPKAKLVVIGEGPGADEDQSGRPFVGRSGQLLTKILASIGFRREEVFICNIVKCRPPSNRNPMRDEIEACLPWLERQLGLIGPKAVLLLGKVAANTILRNTLPLGAMRGKAWRWEGRDCFVTYHPAALLRNPNWKRGCWEDVQQLRRHYDTITGTEANRENEKEQSAS